MMSIKNNSGFSLLGLLFTGLLTVTAPAEAQLSVDFTNSSGYGLGASSVMIENIRVDQTLANPFDPTRPEIVSTVYNIPWTFDYNAVALVPDLNISVEVNDSTQCAALDVYVTSSTTGQVISGAQVQVGSSYALTDSNGLASFTGLTSGSAQIEANAVDFAEGTRPATLSCESGTSLGLALNPLSGEGALTHHEVRVILSWGENPRDLDSHLTGPTSTNNGTADDTDRFHVYYSGRTGDVAVLDVDDTSSYGPETITITPPEGSSILRPGLYRYSVHHYAGEGNISTSGASVTLQYGSTTRYFTPPTGAQGDEDLWTVFEMQVSSSGAITIYTQNTINTNWTGGAHSVPLLAPGEIAPMGEAEQGFGPDSLPDK